MPSPLPGMDPYLETPYYWEDFHSRFIAYAARELQPQLPLRYRARIESRVVFEAEEGWLEPDVMIVEKRLLREAHAQSYCSGSNMELDEPVILKGLRENDEQPYIKIIDRQGNRLVTVIELLSPTNKLGSGRLEYQARRKELFQSGANLVEIDLLRQGPPPAPVLNLEPVDDCYSTIYVWRAAVRRHEAYFVKLQNRLPSIHVPLLAEDADVGLNVQCVFTSCYDDARYDLDIEYAEPPPVHLSSDDTVWLDQFLCDKGLRNTPTRRHGDTETRGTGHS